MQLLKLTVLSSLLFAIAISFTSCEKDAEKKKVLEYAKSAIAMTGAQAVPVSTSSALGFLDVYYNKTSKILSYKVTWSGLTGNPTGFGIHGLAPVGYAASLTPVQVFSLTGLTASGTYSGNLTLDGIVVKEENVLNGFYYVNIKTAANPNGEIRGQIIFQ